MNGSEFLRKLRALARRRRTTVEIIRARGKGSHVTVYFGRRLTILKDRRKEIGRGLLGSMCRDLGIRPDDL
jgi:mRNA interferase HicA